MKTSMMQMVSGLGVGMVLASAGSALGADYRRYFVPDYDQVRGAIFDVEGLPNNGAMYCVPTAAMNLMSYIAQRGFPFVPPSSGDFGPDAGGAAYNEMTNWLKILGQEMGTDEYGGTGGEGAEAGITAFLESGAPGAFTVTRCYVSDEFCPPPSHLAFHAITGGLVLQRIGWYEAGSGVNAFNRTGGHVVTLNGLDDYDTDEPTMRWRDPGSDEGNMFFQSAFTTNSSDTLKVVGTFEGLPRTQYRLTGYNSPAFIDGYIAIRPKFAIFTTLPHTGFGFKAPDPVTPDDPGSLTFDMPNGGTLGALALGWDQLSVIATTIDPTSGMHAFQRFTIGSPDPEPVLISLLLPAVQKVREAASRRMYVLSDGSVREYEFDVRGTAVETASTEGTVDASDYALWRENGAAASGTCMGVLTTASELLMLDEDLEVASRWFLPNAVAIGAGARMDFGPDDSLWVFSSGVAYNYAFGAGATLQLVDTIDFGAVLGSSAPVGGVQVMDNGRMHVEIGGTLRTLAKDAANGWGEIPSQFTGLATNGGPWQISDNASNFIPGVHDTESWDDVFPAEFPGVTAECPWDLNKDGVTDFADLNLVLNNWGHQGLIEDAGDATGDGAVTFEDLNLVLAHWGEGCE